MLINNMTAFFVKALKHTEFYIAKTIDFLEVKQYIMHNAKMKKPAFRAGAYISTLRKTFWSLPTIRGHSYIFF